jgi:signal transduction histidine kinase
MRNEMEDRSHDGLLDSLGGGLGDRPQDRLREDLVREMAHDLHELCQPLTALQCRLELARMMGDAGLLLETVEDSLTETRRMFSTVGRMRERLMSEEALEWVGNREARASSDGR